MAEERKGGVGRQESRGQAWSGDRQSHIERHTEGEGEEERYSRLGGQIQGKRSGEVRRQVYSEYGGLVLSADCPLGVLGDGVHQPRGTALGLGIPHQLQRVHL